MTDGNDTTLDQIAPEVPASAEVETSSQPSENAFTNLEAQEEAVEAEETETEVDEDSEEEEIERNGKKYRIPKALKGELMMQSDYTRKTQELAEERKTQAAEREALNLQAHATKELNEDRKKLVILEDYLDRQSKVNWQQLFSDDPLDAPRKWAEYQHWKDAKTTLASKIEETEQEQALKAQHERAKRVEEGRQVLAREIKGWNADTAKKVAEFGISNGLSPQEVSNLDDPRLVKILHQAWLGSQLLQKQQTAAKTPVVPQEPIKPLAQVSARGTSPAARKPLSAMSMEEYAAARKAGRSV